MLRTILAVILGYGFQAGNALQTLVFLIPHALLVVLFGTGSKVGLSVTLGLTVLPMAWIQGWALAKRDCGSIFTAWLIDSGVNFGTLVYAWLFVPSLAAGS